LAENFAWGSVAEALTRSVVECVANLFHFERRADAREVRPFRKELSQQSVQAFVRAALSDMAQSREINVEVRDPHDTPMIGAAWPIWGCRQPLSLEFLYPRPLQQPKIKKLLLGLRSNADSRTPALNNPAMISSNFNLLLLQLSQLTC
jgi:hypothetical protein